MLTSSHALTPTASLEAEGGVLSPCAASVNDASASGGAAVRFNGCSGNPDDPTNLDASGTTIPDTNYPIPAGAIFMAANGSDSNSGTQSSPVKTLNKAIGLVPGGGTIVVRGGTYRDWYNNGSGSFQIASKGFTLQAYPHEQVWFDGTDVIPTGNWTSDGQGHWYMAWSTPQFCNGHYYDYPYNAQNSANTGPCSHWDQYGNTEANYPAAGDPQMVFINGQRMAEVDQLSLATGGKFYYDWTNKRIYISTNPSGNTVELATRPVALVFGGSGLTVRGIGFKRYATNEYNNTTNAALYVGGSGQDVIENDVFTQMAGEGLALSNPQSPVINHSVFAFNGFNGMGANGDSNSNGTDNNLLLENSVLNNNNTEMYGLNCSISCASAGIKMGHMSGFVIKNNIIENTQGSAKQGASAWCDTNCYNGVFVGNLVKNNAAVGYHYEQDYNGIVAGNVFVGNGVTGIDVSAAGAKIWNNTIIDSGERNTSNAIELRIYDDNRPLVTSNISVGNNVIYHPLTSGNVVYMAGYGTNYPDAFMTYFDYDSIWDAASTSWMYRWIGSTDTHYTSSSALNAAHPPLEAHAQSISGGSDPFFTNLSGGDYTIRSDSTAYHSGGVIPSDVAAALGVSTAAGQTRGAFSWPGK